MYRLTGIFLFLLHLALWFWAFGGMTEWIFIDVPWPAYRNPDFPGWLLFSTGLQCFLHPPYFFTDFTPDGAGPRLF